LVYPTDVEISHSLRDKIKVYLSSNKQRTLYTWGKNISLPPVHSQTSMQTPGKYPGKTVNILKQCCR